MTMGGYEEFMDIFLGVNPKLDYIWGHFYTFYGLFLFKGTGWGIFFGCLLKNSNIFWVCLKFLIFFGVNV